jgi:hypothetical protein
LLPSPPASSRRLPLAGAGALLALLLVLAWPRGGPDAVLERFDAGTGSRHYAIDLGGALAGRLREERDRDPTGAPRIRTHTELNLPGGGRLQREERLRFDARPPHALLEHRVETVSPRGVRTQRRLAPGDATLADWFEEGAGQSGVARDDEGRILEYRRGTSFVLRRVARAPELTAPGPLAPLELPVARSLGDRGRLDHLAVRVDGPAAPLFTEGPGLRTRAVGEGRVLESRRLPLPADAARLALARAVLETVRERITYVPGASPPDLEALLEGGEGDCWEFAALYDALVRRAGLESRVVTGLAWNGEADGAFALHAWNEVADGNGGWFAVDPTWGQLGADAARLRFPDDAAAQLDLQFALAASRIEVLVVEPPPAVDG